MAKKYPKQFIDCKAWGHGHWEEYTPDPGEFKKPEIGRYFFQLCADCGVIRYRSVHRITGAYLDTSWKYKQPDGYKPDKPMDRQDFRRLYFQENPIKKTKLRLVV